MLHRTKQTKKVLNIIEFTLYLLLHATQLDTW